MSHSGKLRNMASVYLLHEDRILLLYRQGNSIVRNLWIGSAGGHFQNDELNDATKCVCRELQEELGLSFHQIENLQLRYITLRNTDDEIRQNNYYFAYLMPNNAFNLPSTEGITQWFNLNELKDLPMPFTARHVMDHYVRIGQFNELLYGGIANTQEVIFTEL